MRIPNRGSSLNSSKITQQEDFKKKKKKDSLTNRKLHFTVTFKGDEKGKEKFEKKVVFFFFGEYWLERRKERILVEPRSTKMFSPKEKVGRNRLTKKKKPQVHAFSFSFSFFFFGYTHLFRFFFFLFLWVFSFPIFFIRFFFFSLFLLSFVLDFFILLFFKWLNCKTHSLNFSKIYSSLLTLLSFISVL